MNRLKVALILIGMSNVVFAASALACEGQQSALCSDQFNDIATDSKGSFIGITEQLQIKTPGDRDLAQKMVEFAAQCRCIYSENNSTPASRIPESLVPKIQEAIKSYDQNQKAESALALKCPKYRECALKWDDVRVSAHNIDKYGMQSKSDLESAEKVDNVSKSCACFVTEFKTQDKSREDLEGLTARVRQKAAAYSQVVKNRERADAKEKADMKRNAALKRSADEQEEKDREAKENSKECRAAKIVGDYCENLNILSHVNSTIDREKEIGRQSGYVNATLLRNSTATKLNLENRNAELVTEYRQVGGQTLSTGMCATAEANYNKYCPAP